MTRTYRTTKIEWTQHTWNPIRGCTPVSEGCINCYAKRMAARFGDKEFKPTVHSERVSEPLKWKKPRMVFVCSMGDIFHEDISDHDLHDIFAVMAEAKKHTFQLLTKRPERMADFLTSGYFPDKFWHDYGKTYEWPLPNVWMGVTAENQRWLDYRAHYLIKYWHGVKFVSCEPLLGAIDVKPYLTFRETGNPREELLDVKWAKYKSGIDWVIAGGETGPGARECQEPWIRSIYEQCQAARIPFFFKQGGSKFIHNGAPYLIEKEWQEHREWPITESQGW